jgi:hypothetical protein
MTGIPLFNHPAFDTAAERLRAIGHTVFSPAEFDRAAGLGGDVKEVSNTFLRNAMRQDTDAICDSDAIALLPGWEKSRGVAVELSLAKYLGLKVICATSGEPLEVP